MSNIEWYVNELFEGKMLISGEVSASSWQQVHLSIFFLVHYEGEMRLAECTWHPRDLDDPHWLRGFCGFPDGKTGVEGVTSFLETYGNFTPVTSRPQHVQVVTSGESVPIGWADPRLYQHLAMMLLKLKEDEQSSRAEERAIARAGISRVTGFIGRQFRAMAPTHNF